MENASKALIIAGAILLAIVIISLGLIVVNNVRTTTDNTNLSEQEIQAFNAKFIAYEGSKVSGSRVNTLIQQVIATNQETIEKGNTNYICIGYHPITTTDNKMTCLCINKNKNIKVINSIDSGDTSKSTISLSTVDQKRTTITGQTDDKAPGSTSVIIGKTYKVELGYKNGIVQNIAVSEE